jgi:carboxymethylenebutenolidase
MLTQGISITSADGHRFGALAAAPAGGRRGPAVVVAQEIFGINAFMEQIIAWLAGQGYAALAPDLYARQAPGVELDPNDEAQKQRAFDLWQRFDMTQGVADLQAAVRYARIQPYCNGRVAVLGYCLGGALALLMAAGSDADATVGYYGVGLEKRLDLVAKVTCPAMFHMGGSDHFVPPPSRTLITQGFARNPLLQVHWYEEAGHSFARTNSPNFASAATALANARTLEFLSPLKGERHAQSE